MNNWYKALSYVKQETVQEGKPYMNNKPSVEKKRPTKVLVVMSEDTGDAAGFICSDPSIQVEVVWNCTFWEDIPKGYKTLARAWGFSPDEEID